MHKIPLLCFAILSAGAVSGSTQIPQVRVEPAIPSVSSNIQEQTRDAVIRDYLHSWRTMSAAFEQNRAVLLEAEFVGVAKEKMTDAILQQARLGIRTRYAVRSHDLQLTFFSPEGLSVELTDNIENKLAATFVLYRKGVACNHGHRQQQGRGTLRKNKLSGTNHRCHQSELEFSLHRFSSKRYVATIVR